MLYTWSEPLRQWQLQRTFTQIFLYLSQLFVLMLNSKTRKRKKLVKVYGEDSKNLLVFPNFISAQYRLCEMSILTNTAPAALQRASGGQPPCGGQIPLSHWVAMIKLDCKVGLHRFASSELTSLFPIPLLCLVILCFTGFGLQQPTWCLHTATSRGTDLAGQVVSVDRYRRQANCVPSPLLVTRGPLAPAAFWRASGGQPLVA